MPEPFRFLHTGDLHLDSPFKGVSGSPPERVTRVLQEATLSAWERIVSLSIERRCDFVLVAGDVFEAETRTLRGQLAFANGLERLAEASIASAVVSGNHDPDSPGAWQATVTWPALAHKFPAGRVTSHPVLRDGREIARVYGAGYPQKAVFDDYAAAYHKESGAPFSIGLLHATVEGSTGHTPYGPTTIPTLIASGMDYWALGHIHKPSVVRDANPLVVYCGNPQGRDPGETEPRGVRIVDVDSTGRITHDFMPVDVVRWTWFSLDIAPHLAVNALRDALVDELRARSRDAGRHLVARIDLVGFGPLHDELARVGGLDDLVSDLRGKFPPSTDPFVWIESIRDESRSVAATTYARGADFLSELDGLVASTIGKLSGAAPKAGDATPLEVGSIVDEMWGDARMRRMLGERPTTGELAELVADAQTLVVDRMKATGGR